MQASWQKLNDENYQCFDKKRAYSLKSWDHPNFSEVKQRLDECNVIRYAAYRLASKLRILQHSLQTNGIPLTLCASIFTKHRLGTTEALLMLEAGELEAVISDIYFAVQKLGSPVDNLDKATEMLLTFLYNVYDRNAEGKIPVIAAKICIAVLSNASLFEIYRYFYTLIADHNNCVTRRRLQILLGYLAAIAEFLQEGSTFGQALVAEAVENCFSNSAGIVGISEDVFMKWLLDSPSILSWLTTFNRLRLSENVSHDVKCSSCKVSPIVGLRYKCMRCIRYTQCQTCYFTARVSHNHKLKHPMQEHCRNDMSCEIPNVFLRKFRKLIRCSESKVNDTIGVNGHDSVSPNLLPASDKDKTVLTDIHSSPIRSIDEHLTAIILQLEQQNKQLKEQMISLRVGNTNQEVLKCLDNHRSSIATQVQKLKLLQQFLQSKPEPTQARIDVESTPMIPAANKGARRLQNATGLNLFSPIVMKQDQIEPAFSNQNSKSSSSSSEQYSVISQNTLLESVPTCSIQDLSTWIGGRPNFDSGITQASSHSSVSRLREVDTDLDAVLEKLHEILANNITFDDSEGADNNQLHSAVTEMEDMLTSLIDGVERSRSKKW